jgi:hypothetical protein
VVDYHCHNRGRQLDQRAFEELSPYYDFTDEDNNNAKAIEAAMKAAPAGSHSRPDGQYYTCLGKCPHIKECMLYGECHNMVEFFPTSRKHTLLVVKHWLLADSDVPIPPTLPVSLQGISVPTRSWNDLDSTTRQIITREYKGISKELKEYLRNERKALLLI